MPDCIAVGIWKRNFRPNPSPPISGLGKPHLHDVANTRNFREPALNASGHPVLSFGIGSSFQGTRWILRRSTDLFTFTEIYRYNGSTHTATRGITYRITFDRGIIIGVAVTDTTAPPAGAFYRFDAEYTP